MPAVPASRLRTRRRVEILIRVLQPFLDVLLVVGERVSRVVEAEDPDYVLARMRGDGASAPRGLGSHERYERDRPAARGYVRDRPAPGGYVRDRPAPGGYERDRPAPGGYVRDRPAPGGYERDRPAPGGYERDRPAPGGYERDRPAARG